jgi:hypothetical protein
LLQHREAPQPALRATFSPPAQGEGNDVESLVDVYPGFGMMPLMPISA